MFNLYSCFGYFFFKFLFFICLTLYNKIINSGQGFSSAIALERIIWAMIGVFFLGAISRSIINSMRSHIWFGRNFLFSYSKDKKITDDSSSKPSNHDE